MEILEWPVADRERVVQTYRPGRDASSEAPFRTLRKHHHATGGVAVALRGKRRLQGRVTVFSSLNVDAARASRRGDADGASRLADAAAELESKAEFRELCGLLAGLNDLDAEAVVGGQIPDTSVSSEVLRESVARLARITEDARRSAGAGCGWAAGDMETVAGQVVEVLEWVIVLHRTDGRRTVLPRSVAKAAHRDHKGDAVMVVTEGVGKTQALIEILPAIMPDSNEKVPFDPFDSVDPRTLVVGSADEILLAGMPAALHVPFPVEIES